MKSHMKVSEFKYLIIALFALFFIPLKAQKKLTVVNDSNTPLHLLQPDYKTPYGIPEKNAIEADLSRILTYLENSTFAEVVDKKTGKTIDISDGVNENSQLKRGDFRIGSYEWGVTYAAMLAASEATGNQRFSKYVYDRFNFLSKAAPEFKRLLNDYGVIDPQMHQIIHPQALDDAGAVCAAMIKASLKNSDLVLSPMIDNYMNYIMQNEYRLYDGTFARKRPQMNTVWLDDMFMSIPAIVQMGVLTGESKYYDEAARQINLFVEKMFVIDKNLFRHGWVESSKEHPSFFWGRANGWALLTLTEVLDVLPEIHPLRDKILNLLRLHIKGITAYQSGDGFWHQLLDRNDSYYETSATAIFVYCIAHAINKKWIDPIAYGPVAILGWNAVSTQINQMGQIDGTCVGTGMAFDPAFYYYRPISVYAAHGYGPVIWAGAEIINLINNYHPKLNDNAIQFYSTEQKTKDPIFSVKE